MVSSGSGARMELARSSRLIIVSAFAALLAMCWTAMGGQVRRVSLCEGTGCDGGDMRLQAPLAGAADLGASLAMGYLDGDLFADLVVGSPGEGRVYIFFGGVSNPSLAEDDSDRSLDPNGADVILFDPQPSSQFGFSVAIGPQASSTDRANHLLVGAPATSDPNSAGAAYVLPASVWLAPSACLGTKVLDITCDTRVISIRGAAPGDETGYSVAFGPVVSMDSAEEDFIVGSRKATASDNGIVYVIGETIETSIDLPADPDVTIRRIIGAAPREGLGEFLAVEAFLDGTAPFEIAIGAVGTSPNDARPGRVYLIDDLAGNVDPNGNLDLASRPARRVQGDSGNDFFGFSLATGRFDDPNGLAQLVVGAIYADRPDPNSTSGSFQNAGALYVFDGTALLGLDDDPNVSVGAAATKATHMFVGDARWDQLGFGLASGDVNSDGYSDLVASARWHDRTLTNVNEVDEGAVYVLHGESGAPGSWANTSDPNDCARGATPTCTKLDCVAGQACALDSNDPFDAAIFGGDYTTSPSSSEELGYAIAVGDFNWNSVTDPSFGFDDVAVSSITHERVYLISLNNQDTPPDPGSPGQQPDDPSLQVRRDLRDRDDDGDGYLDTEEDADADGDVETGESNPYVPDRDVTVGVAVPDPNLPCADPNGIEVIVTVSNASRRLQLLDPLLGIDLPDPPFMYLGGTTEIRRPGMSPQVVVDPNGEFAFDPNFRSITPTGAPRTSDPLDPNEEIQVSFRVKLDTATSKLAFGAVPTDVVRAYVDLPVAEQPEVQGSLDQTNVDASGTIRVLRPDLVVTKTALDVDGGPYLDPNDRLQYTIVVRNDGPTSTFQATGAMLLDPVLPGARWIGTDALPLGATDASDPNTVRVNLAPIPVGQSATVVFTVQVDETDPNGTVITDQATVSETCQVSVVSDSNEAADDDPGEVANNPADPNDDDATKDAVTADPKIFLMKSSDLSTAQVGDTIRYTYRVSIPAPGNVRLSAIDPNDSSCTPLVRDPNTDLNGDQVLDWAETGSGAETWVYTCDYVVPSGTPVAPLMNLARVRGVPPAGGMVAADANASVDILNTPPVANPDDYVVDEDTTLMVTDPNLGVLANDTDLNPQTLTAMKVVDPSNGTVTVNSDGTLTYVPDQNYFGPDSFTYKANDGMDDGNVATVSVTVNAVNDASAVDLDGNDSSGAAGRDFSTSFTEGGPAVGIADTDALITDVDDTVVQRATVTLTNPQAGDALSESGALPGGIALDAGSTATQRILTGAASLADYEAVIELVRFDNSSMNPSTAPRTVTVVVRDAALDSAAATTTITVSAANDAPAVDLDADDSGGAAGSDFSTSFTEGGAAAGIADADTVVDDPDDTMLQRATVTLTNPQTGDALSESGALPGGITLDAGSTATQRILTGAASLANYETAIERVQFSNNSENPSTTPRTVTVVGRDAALDSAAATTLITVSAANDGPAVDLDADDSSGATGNDFSASFTEGGPAVGIADTDALITDVDDTMLQRATVTLTNPQTGDALSESGALPAGITLDAGSTATQRILTGAASLADYEAAIELVRFDNSSMNPSTAPRTVTVVVRDAALDSAAATTTITVSAVNNAPTVDLDSDDSSGATGNDYDTAYVAAGPAVTIADVDPNVEDVDSALLQRATVTLTNPQTGDALSESGALPGGIALDAGSTGTQRILTGSASLADYETAIALVQFSSTEATPSTVDRTVSVVVRDDTAVDSPAATTTITVSLTLTGPGPEDLSVEAGKISWSSVSSAVDYHLYRGNLAVLRSAGLYTQDPATTAEARRFCGMPTTQYDDGYEPPAGVIVFYLVTADDGVVEGSLGQDSGGMERPNANPCP